MCAVANEFEITNLCSRRTRSFESNAIARAPSRQMTSIPLRAVSSARPDLDGLTPRTPRSRSGRFDEVDLRAPTDTSEPDTDGDGLSDSEPLLRNDDSTEEPPDSSLQPPAFLTDRARFSFIALTVILILLFILDVVYRESERAEDVYDHKLHGGHSSLTLISYENYTKFPLTPKQYRAECRKMHHGEMRHMAYWTDLMVDVPHSSSALGICKSTITYMLGSEVGLMGDLALLAQVAALAESVSSRV